MSRLRRSAAVAVAAAGLGLIGSAVQGLVQVDGTLQAATREQRQQQQRLIEVEQRQPADCPAHETQRL